MAQNKSKTIAKNAGFLYIRMFLIMIVSLFTSRIVLKTLGFEDFGIYNVVNSVVVFFSFMQYALRNATSRYITYEIGSGNTERLQKVYSMAINSHILLAVIFFIGLEFGGIWFLNNKLNISDNRLEAANWAFQFSLINFCISIIRTPWESNIVAHEKFNFYAITSILQVALNLIAVYVLAYSPIDKLVTYAFFLSFNVGAIFLCYVTFCKKNFKETKYLKVWDTKILKEFTSYSGWSLIVNMACGFSHHSISIFFNMFLGTVANAALGVCNQVVSQLNVFVGNFTQAFNPQIIKSYAAKDYDYFFKLIFASSKISYILMLFIGIPVCANVDTILSVWLGEYPHMAPTLICVTLTYYLIEVLQAPLVQAVHANGKIKIHQIWVASFNFLAVPVMYLVLYMGMSGEVVIGIWTLTNIAAAVFRTIYLKKLVAFPTLLYARNVVLRIIFYTIICLPVPVLLGSYISNKYVAFFSSCIFSVIITIFTGLYVALNKSERALLFNIPIIKKITSKLHIK